MSAAATRKKRRDYVVDVSLEFANHLVSFAQDMNCVIEEFEGCLLDSYVIFNTDRIKIGRVKPRNYIIIRAIYLNEWTSKLEMIMTDNENKVDEFIESQTNFEIS